MNQNQTTHTFHIPVMGTGFTIDTPLRVAHLGINSVMSLVDDVLVEKMRQMHAEQRGLPFEPIPASEPDHRARRITAWLDLVADITAQNFASLTQNESEINRYVSLLPSESPLRKAFKNLMRSQPNPSEVQAWAEAHLCPGSADVNVMTKLDRENFDRDGAKMSAEYNDAHAAVRGFAHSKLRGAIVFSAGMNPRLYSYMEQLPVFYPDAQGSIAKRIILKVSDYRSALIQGRFLARKGLWVSEYRVESGLNCGGHAFATDGFLMGPILEEFRQNREAMHQELYTAFAAALTGKNLPCPPSMPLPRLSAQGGVGSWEEHNFLRMHYGVDSVGWGTPFLLVPEVTNVDEATLKKLSAAREDDLELSHVSPLGVPYNNLKGNTKDLEKIENIQKGRPGSSCPKKYIALNKEFSDQGICMASRQYQHLKLKELYDKGLPFDAYQEARNRVEEKSCICVGLGTAALLVNELETRVEGQGVSVCPGPNMAYFSGVRTLDQMLDHVYGRSESIARGDRPHMFIKELSIYVDYLSEKMQQHPNTIDEKQAQYFRNFAQNINAGIAYYQDLFASEEPWSKSEYSALQAALHKEASRLEELVSI